MFASPPKGPFGTATTLGVGQSRKLMSIVCAGPWTNSVCGLFQHSREVAWLTAQSSTWVDPSAASVLLDGPNAFELLQDSRLDTDG
jgi:hypothetical protein